MLDQFVNVAESNADYYKDPDTFIFWKNKPIFAWLLRGLRGILTINHEYIDISNVNVVENEWNIILSNINGKYFDDKKDVKLKNDIRRVWKILQKYCKYNDSNEKTIMRMSLLITVINE